MAPFTAAWNSSLLEPIIVSTVSNAACTARNKPLLGASTLSLLQRKLAQAADSLMHGAGAANAWRQSLKLTLQGRGVGGTVR